MKLFFKMKPLLRSAQAEEELAALRAELRGLRGALATAEAKRQELEETHVSVTQEKNDLALQLQAVRRGGAGFLSVTWCPDPRASSGNPRLLRGNSTGRPTVPHSPRPPPPPPAQPRPTWHVLGAQALPGSFLLFWRLMGSYLCAASSYPTSPPSQCTCPSAPTPWAPMASC